MKSSTQLKTWQLLGKVGKGSTLAESECLRLMVLRGPTGLGHTMVNLAEILNPLSAGLLTLQWQFPIWNQKHGKMGEKFQPKVRCDCYPPCSEEPLLFHQGSSSSVKPEQSYSAAPHSGMFCEWIILHLCWLQGSVRQGQLFQRAGNQRETWTRLRERLQQRQWAAAPNNQHNSSRHAWKTHSKWNLISG